MLLRYSVERIHLNHLGYSPSECVRLNISSSLYEYGLTLLDNCIIIDAFEISLLPSMPCVGFWLVK